MFAASPHVRTWRARMPAAALPTRKDEHERIVSAMITHPDRNVVVEAHEGRSQSRSPTLHPNRRPPSALALLSLVCLTAALALALVQNVELDALAGTSEGIAQFGIEGEGDLPLPVA